MNRLFAYIIGFLLMAACTMVATQAIAGEYIPMIDTSKEWQYTLSAEDMDPQDVSFRFDGTRTVADRTYHVFHPISGMSAITEAFDGYCIDFPLEFLLREENGKVYTLPYPQMTSGDYACDGLTPSDEYLLYDFSGDGGTQFETIAMDVELMKYVRVKVRMTPLQDSVEQNGKTYPLYSYETDNGGTMVFPNVAQGLGPVQWGIVAWPDCLPKTASIHYPEPTFCFKGLSAAPQTISSIPLIREDRVW